LSETRGYLDDLKVAEAAAKPKKKPVVKTGKVEISAKAKTKKASK
jgi:hypothetical protein